MNRRNLIKTTCASLFGGATMAAVAVTKDNNSFNNLSLEAQEWVRAEWPKIQHGLAKPFHIGFNSKSLTKGKLEAIRWLQTKGAPISILPA